MATAEDARRAWVSITDNFQRRRSTRLAFLGDGQGSATSNVVVSANPLYVYARDRLGENRYFAVVNHRVTPAANLPVVIGTTDDEPDREQVLGLNYAALEYSSNASIVGGSGPHHAQHEFGGGDEVFIDPRLIKPGLIKPTNPPSMKVKVLSFVYFYDSWKLFIESESIDFTEHIPASDKRYVMVAVDTGTNRLVYRVGNVFSGVPLASFLSDGVGGLLNVPGPSGDEIPIGAVLLETTTTKIDWNINGVNNIFESRIHIGTSYKRILDRLDQVEGLLGFKPNLATTGAADTIADDFPSVIDGGQF